MRPTRPTLRIGTVSNRKRRRRAPGEPLGPRVRAALRSAGTTALRAGRPVLRVGAALAVAALVTGAGLVAYRALVRSPRFAIAEVRLPTLERIPRDELERLVGVRPGESLLGADIKAAEAALATHPWIKTARVRRELPRTLVVEVTERKPVALVALGGPLYLVERDGVPFKRAAMAETDGLPIVTGVARDRYRAVPEAAHALFREAVSVADAYAAGGQRPPLGEIHADPRYGFELETVRGARIHLGRGDLAAKLRRLDLVLQRLGAEVAEIRLDNATRPDRVTVRPAST